MVKLREVYRDAGALDMISHLRQEYGMMVSKRVVTEYFHHYEKALVQQRKARRLRRKKFWAAGVNDLWTLDQHDKWKHKFGLALHVGLDPVAGVILWLKIWWTNSNPRLIMSYYLEVVVHLGFMPMISQSDRGSENHGVAWGHTYLRHWHDPGLAGTLQHRWMTDKKNVTPEIFWSQLRSRWSPGFEDLLELGVINGYDPDDYLDAMTFRWVFIPFLQRELDLERDRYNSFRKRADKNKLMPTGRPIQIFEHPGQYNLTDFKIKVELQAVEEARQLYAPPDNEVFQLVPPEFGAMAMEFYTQLGSPTITRESCWEIYLEIQHRFRVLEEEGQLAEVGGHWRELVWSERIEASRPRDIRPLEEQGFQDLAGGENGYEQDNFWYSGGVNGGTGPEPEPQVFPDQDLEEMAGPSSLDAQQPAEASESEDEFDIDFVNDRGPTLFVVIDSDDDGGPDAD